MENLRNGIVMALVVPIVLLFGASTLAQMGMGGGMGQGMHMPKYDRATAVIVQGTVQEVQEGMMQSGQNGQMQGMGHMGLHLVLKTNKETLMVFVGPSSFVKEKNFTFAKGDQIEVAGSKVKYDDSVALIAREIKKEGKTLTLRDENGVPAWSMGSRH
jgi:hypothetical protein